MAGKKGMKWNRARLSPFGVKLELLMAEKGLSASDIARKAGLERQRVYALKFTRYPRPETLSLMARAFDVPISYFYGV